MYKIALCDDDLSMLAIMKEQINRILEEENVERQIDTFSDSTEMMQHIVEKDILYDAYFLDIDMPEINGMEIAAKLYEDDVHNNIVFITDREDLVFEAIHYRPFRFIRKHHLTEELREALVALLQKKERENVTYTFYWGKNESVHLAVKDIVYMESFGHSLRVYAGENVYKVRGKISSYELELSDRGFVRIYNTLLVNIRYVYSVSAKGVVMDDNKLLPVSRSNLRKVKEKHMEYMRRYINGDS